MAEMSSSEFNEERDLLLLREVPEQFKYFFSIIALDISFNSERYEDAIMKLKDWIILFKQGLNDYQEVSRRCESNCDCDRCKFESPL